MLRERREGDLEPAAEPPSLSSPCTLRIENLVREHFNGVWRLVRRYGLNAADADDVAQRTMMIAAQRIDEIALGRERAFVYRTAVHITSRMHRDRSRHPVHSLEEREEIVDSNLDPEGLLEQRRARARLDEILSQLPEELRVVFLLYEIESFSQGEIASILGIPQGTASSRLRRAREYFEGLLQRSNGAKRSVCRTGAVP